jgi:hypothetical protein
VTRWAADLDQAAETADALGIVDPASRAGLRQFVALRARLRAELERVNADAGRLGLVSCRMRL